MELANIEEQSKGLFQNNLRSKMKSPIIVAVTFFLLITTGCNSDSGSAETGIKAPMISLEPEITVEEGTQASIKSEINVDESFTLTFDSSDLFNLSPVVSSDSRSVELTIPTVSSDTIIRLNLTADNGSERLSDSVTIKILDTVPTPLETYTTQSSEGKELAILIDRFLDLTTTSEYYLNGLIVSDARVPPHSKTIEMVDYSISNQHINNLPSDRHWRIGTSSIYDMTVVQDTSQRVWLVENDEFQEKNKIQLKRTNTILPSVVLWESQENQRVFQYAYLHNNTNFINALNQAYIATSDEKFIRFALKTAEEIIMLLDNGLYKRQFLNESDPVYTGMNQGIILESLYNLARLSQDKNLYAEVKEIARQYRHTTEGVWNHYTNSVIGGLIAERLNIDTGIDIENDINNKIPMLINEIDRLDGKIPYIMNRQDERYLNLSPTYHTYDFMLQAKLSAYIDDKLNLHRVLDKIVDKIDVNYSSFYANNTEALLFAFQSSGYVNQDFARNQRNRIDVKTDSLVAHISYLRAASALLMLQEHTDHPDLK